MTKFITNVSDDKLDIISQKISFNKSVSDDTKWQAVETNAYENKISNLWFKKITKLEQENKVLKEVNSKLLTVLKQLRISLKTAQQDQHILKDQYNTLQTKNKDLKTKLQNTKKMMKNASVDHSGERPRKKRILDNKNTKDHSSAYCVANEGLLYFVVKY